VDRDAPNDRYAPRVNVRGLAALATAAVTIAACLPQPGTPTPTPTPRATSARPKFELASYMYALQTRGKIRIGVLDDAPPFAQRAGGGSYTGFEPDLGRELAQSIFGPQQNIDSVIEWVSVDRSTGVSVLAGSRADVVIARLDAGDARTASIDLTRTYFVTGERIVVRSLNDEIKDLADLDTKTVCVRSGSPTAAHVVDANEFARTLELDTYLSCLGAVQHGQADAIGADQATLWNLMKEDPATKLVGRNLTTERYAIGAKKNAGGDRNGFVDYLNDWLRAAIAAGVWARLYTQDITPLSGDSRTSPPP
jgi:ABC-type amino acid transport substrate-binding protein